MLRAAANFGVCLRAADLENELGVLTEALQDGYISPPDGSNRRLKKELEAKQIALPMVDKSTWSL